MWPECECFIHLWFKNVLEPLLAASHFYEPQITHRMSVLLSSPHQFPESESLEVYVAKRYIGS